MSVVTRTASLPPAGPSSGCLSDLASLKQPCPQDNKATTGLLPAKPLPPLPVIKERTSLVVVGGHRGNGENLFKSNSSLAVRENTIASFRRAVQGGAAFLEFDIQVTSDGVPVIWHDNWIQTIDQSGSIKRQLVRDTTLEQFKALVPMAGKSAGTRLVRNFKTHSGSFLATAESWVVAEEEKLPTLAEVFEAIPEHVGFDMEVKTTTPSTWLETPASEVKRIVDAVTTNVQRLHSGTTRPIAFSSFDPDICQSLRLSQTFAPVLFLSSIGEGLHCDPRRTSLEAAIAVALSSSLQGIVFHSGALRRQPSAARQALEKGLSVLTFGLDNNDPKWVQEQHALGVQAAIVDNAAEIVPAVAAAVQVLIPAS